METSPVGIPVPLFGVTVTLKGIGEPWVVSAVGRFKVVVVGLNVTLPQLFTRLLTFTDPNPVVMS
jgi:hypothetical protein